MSSTGSVGISPLKAEYAGIDPQLETEKVAQFKKKHGLSVSVPVRKGSIKENAVTSMLSPRWASLEKALRQTRQDQMELAPPCERRRRSVLALREISQIRPSHNLEEGVKEIDSAPEDALVKIVTSSYEEVTVLQEESLCFLRWIERDWELVHVRALDISEGKCLTDYKFSEVRFPFVIDRVGSRPKIECLTKDLRAINTVNRLFGWVLRNKNMVPRTAEAVLQKMTVCHEPIFSELKPFGKIRVPIAECKGRREFMEDAVSFGIMNLKGSIVGYSALFDGHGFTQGHRLSHFMASCGMNFFELALQKYCDFVDIPFAELSLPHLETAALYACYLLDEWILEKYKEFEGCGTTALITLKIPKPDGQIWLFVISVGDSEALLCLKDGRYFRLNEPGEAANSEFEHSIFLRGGEIRTDQHGTPRVSGLMPVRVFGDHISTYQGIQKPKGISARPRCSLVKLASDGMKADLKTDQVPIERVAALVMHCDGLAESLSSDLRAKLAIEGACSTHLETAAVPLCQHAVERGSGDNCSVILLSGAMLKDWMPTNLSMVY